MKKTLIAVGAGLSVPVVFGGALIVWAATANAAKPDSEDTTSGPTWPIKLYCEHTDNHGPSFTIEIPQEVVVGDIAITSLQGAHTYRGVTETEFRFYGGDNISYNTVISRITLGGMQSTTGKIKQLQCYTRTAF